MNETWNFRFNAIILLFSVQRIKVHQFLPISVLELVRMYSWVEISLKQIDTLTGIAVNLRTSGMQN